MTDEHSCFPLDADGETVLVHGDPDMSPEGQEALKAVVRAAQARALADPEWEANAARQAARIAELRARVGLT